MTTPVDYPELLRTFATELVVVFTAALVLGLDLKGRFGVPVARRSHRVALAGAAGLGVALFTLISFPPLADAPAASFVLAPTTLWAKAAVLILSLLSLLLLSGGTFSRHVGEYCALHLLATTGLLFMIGSENALMLFASLELSSLSLYALTALNQRVRTSTEAALKYFLAGSAAAAFTLFGLSLIYGVTGSLQFPAIAVRLSSHAQDPLLWIALALTIAGFGFKVAAAPFHAWAPDVYQVAPGPAAALVASGSKLAGFLILARLLQVGLGPAAGNAAWLRWTPGWLPIVAILALASMVVGNLAALAQTRVRRLVAWSAIAQAGYALTGLAGTSPHNVEALMYFAFTYGLAVIGIFGVLEVLDQAGEPDALDALAGLRIRSPLLTFCLTVFVLSLAGIPPFAGFFGKLFLFASALRRGDDLQLLWLVLVALGLSVVSLYYYLQVLKPALVHEPPAGKGAIHVPRLAQITLVIIAFVILILGCMPRWATAVLPW